MTMSKSGAAAAIARVGALVLVLMALAIGYALVSAELAVAATAAALGPQVTIGAPENGYVGLLTVSPKHAPAGAPVTLSAEGLPPGEEFQLVWSTAIGAWNVTDTEYHGREFTPVAYEIEIGRASCRERV